MSRVDCFTNKTPLWSALTSKVGSMRTVCSCGVGNKCHRCMNTYKWSGNTGRRSCVTWSLCLNGFKNDIFRPRAAVDWSLWVVGCSRTLRSCR